MPFGLKNTWPCSNTRWKLSFQFSNFSLNPGYERCHHLLLILLRKPGLLTDCIGTTVRACFSLILREFISSKACITFLNQFVQPGRPFVTTKTPNALHSLHQAMNLAELRLFEDRCDVFRWFIQNFKCISAALNKKMGNNQPFHFKMLDRTKIILFERVKHQFLSPRIMALPTPNRRYILDTGACDNQVERMILTEL